MNSGSFNNIKRGVVETNEKAAGHVSSSSSTFLPSFGLSGVQLPPSTSSHQLEEIVSEIKSEHRVGGKAHKKDKRLPYPSIVKSSSLSQSAKDLYQRLINGANTEHADINDSSRMELKDLHLSLASRHGYTDQVVSLLMKGANCDIRNFDGVTPLMLASEGGHLNIAKHLIDAEAEVNLIDDQGLNALMLSKSPDMKNLLQSAGADLNYRDDKGDTALTRSCIIGCVQNVTALLSQGADANRIGTRSSTPLQLALEKAYLMIAKLLVSSGADVNKGTCMTPLEVSCSVGDREAKNWLLSVGANINVGKPLLFAIWNNKEIIAMDLIAEGADMNCRDVNGCTPLMANGDIYGRVFRSKNLLMRLLMEGADDTLVDNEGHNCFFYYRFGFSIEEWENMKGVLCGSKVDIILKSFIHAATGTTTEDIPLANFVLQVPESFIMMEHIMRFLVI